MTFMELAKFRQSNRKYKETPVERDKIERCLEAARIAPSACNSQPWYFIVIDDPELRKKVARETFGAVLNFNHFSLTAPVMVVVVTEPSNLTARVGGAIKNRPYNLIDIGIAAEHFCLQAAEEGLGTCMLGWFNEKPLNKLLKIPDGKKIDMVITMGYPEDKQRDKTRKKIDEIRHYNLEK